MPIHLPQEFFQLPPANKPQKKPITGKYLNKNLPALSNANELMKKRVELFMWINKISPTHLTERSEEREDFFNSGFLQPELLAVIFATLKTIQGTERDYIPYLLENISDDPPPNNRAASRDRSNDLLFTPVSRQKSPTQNIVVPSPESLRDQSQKTT